MLIIFGYLFVIRKAYKYVPYFVIICIHRISYVLNAQPLPRGTVELYSLLPIFFPFLSIPIHTIVVFLYLCILFYLNTLSEGSFDRIYRI